MSWINELEILSQRPKTTEWCNSYKLLKQYEEKFKGLKQRFSLFELSRNTRGENFFNAFKICCENPNFFDISFRLPHVVIVYVFHVFFEDGRGDDFFKCVANRCGVKLNAIKDKHTHAPVLHKIWRDVFPDDELDQKTGISRELFCSRCWLIRSFQQGAGNSQLCHAVRYFKNFDDKTLRLHAENYPFDVSQRFGGNFKRLLESPACRLERDYLIDFADNGAVDKERFAWFEQLDEKSKAALGELLQIAIDGNVPCFCVPNIYDFDVDDSIDRIVVKFLLRGSNAAICPFEKKKGGWKHTGNDRSLKQPIWKVTGIIKCEYSNNTIVRTEDILGKKLGECCDDDRSGAFLINRENSRAGIYAPFARRRIPVGQYYAYAFEYSNENYFEVRHQIKNSADVHLVRVNDNPVGVDRSFTVEGEDDLISLSFNDSSEKEHIFAFGINRRSPIREDGRHEKLISRNDPNHLFINYHNWPSSDIDPTWHYEVNGSSVQGKIDESYLYKTGRLVFYSGGIQFDERSVTFVDFSSEEVCGRFPVLGVGECATITLSNCGSIDGGYTVDQDCTTFKIPLRGGDWKLNVPIRRDGVVFRTEDGDEALSLPFKEEDAIVTKDLAIEDLQKLRCSVYCSGADEYVAITSMIYFDGTERKCHIPLMKDRDGFVFSESRRYLASRAGRGGDKLLADLLSNQLQVKSFVIEKRVGNAGECEAKCCQINLYDPKMEPPVEKPRIVDGLITVKLYVPYFTRSCTKKVMKYLLSTGLDSSAGVRELTGFTELYGHFAESGRWCITLTKTTMHQDVSVLRSGASLLSFMVDRVDGGADRLISGGFCLLGDEHNLQVVRENWVPASAFHASMHERYGTNALRLGDMFGMLTLQKWEDFPSVDEGRKELKRRISQLMANINALGRRADMYMNSLYNTRSDQWSGYIYFAGWYFVEKVYEEMSAHRDEEDGGHPIEDCRCLSSSTGKRIWSPLMFSCRAYIMMTPTNGGARNWWREYYERLSQHEVTADVFHSDEYHASIAPVLSSVGISVENGLEDAVNKLHQQILDWRRDVDTHDIVCDDNKAAALFCRTQSLRNALLELSEIDKWFEEEDTTGCADCLFCDLLKIIDAKYWHNKKLF